MMSFRFKLLILGDSGVGKTSLMNNYLDKPFCSFVTSTIGMEYENQNMRLRTILSDEKYEEINQLLTDRHLIPLNEKLDQVKLEIWNSSGQERFHSIVCSYFRNARGVIFVVDLTQPHTLNSVGEWINDFNRHHRQGISSVPAILVANKADLNFDRRISNQELADYAGRYGLPYYVVSSKMDSTAIQSIFIEMMERMIQNFIDQPPDMQLHISPINVGKKTKSKGPKCCF